MRCNKSSCEFREIRSGEREVHVRNLSEASIFVPEFAQTSRAFILLADSKRTGFATLKSEWRRSVIHGRTMGSLDFVFFKTGIGKFILAHFPYKFCCHITRMTTRNILSIQALFYKKRVYWVIRIVVWLTYRKTVGVGGDNQSTDKTSKTGLPLIKRDYSSGVYCNFWS